jgi:hypothetical protein
MYGCWKNVKSAEKKISLRGIMSLKFRMKERKEERNGGEALMTTHLCTW